MRTNRHDETGRATLRAASSSSMPVGDGVDPADPGPGIAHLNDRRRELAEHSPAMIMTSFVESRFHVICALT